MSCVFVPQQLPPSCCGFFCLHLKIQMISTKTLAMLNVIYSLQTIILILNKLKAN
jgi:hypothetical protein